MEVSGQLHAPTALPAGKSFPTMLSNKEVRLPQSLVSTLWEREKSVHLPMQHIVHYNTEAT
jgi:hypothetical protein